MKKCIFLLTLSLLLSSCKEETVQELILFIKNDSNQTITVKLFPKPDYKQHSHLYKMGVGSGYYACEFSLDSSMQRALFHSPNIFLEPHVLTEQVFDSIQVLSEDNLSINIRFSPAVVIGYDKNLFSSSSFWTYKITNQDLATMFKKNPHEFHEYTFHISNP